MISINRSLRAAGMLVATFFWLRRLWPGRR